MSSLNPENSIVNNKIIEDIDFNKFSDEDSGMFEAIDSLIVSLLR